MAWGQPSYRDALCPACAPSAGASAEPSKIEAARDSQLSSTTDNPTRDSIELVWRQLQQLNAYFDFRLSKQKLSDLARCDVLPEIEHSLGLSPVELYTQTYSISCLALITATSPATRSRDASNASNAPDAMSTPLLGQFLVAINGFVKAGNAAQLADYLVIEPPFNQQYQTMIQELRQVYPKGKEQLLEAKCQHSLAGADGWSNFIRFMGQYLAYLRDVSLEQSKYLDTYEHLLDLQSKANSALAQGASGNLILETVITNAKLLCRLAIGLDRKPELMAHLTAGGAGADDSGGQRETLPERAANTVRSAFVTCLNDRSESVNDKPKGKQLGIYTLANLCLKILFQCRKTRNATQIFENISNAAPPITAYAKSQRVTYLYYLGRFLFQNSHFYRAQLALQHAYDESPTRPQCIKQRRLILVYLTASNVILGRFPSAALLDRPEAHDFRQHFLPLCAAIRQGDLRLFNQHLDPSSPRADWFLRFRIFFQLRNRCEVLVWRSLARKAFQLCGTRPPPDSRVAAQLDLAALIAALASLSPPDDGYADPDFDGAGPHNASSSTDYQALDVLAVESLLSSLIDQGLVSGYVAHERRKLAILGAHRTDGDPVRAGFPNVWAVIRRRCGGSGDVPGWKKENPKPPGAQPPVFGGPGPGMVVNLSGVKAVGAFG